MDSAMLMQLLVPESQQLMHLRFRILRAILHEQPIGRRGLAKQLNMSERVLRSETDLLKQQNFITYSASGMSLTTMGVELFRVLERQISQFIGMTLRESQIADKLGVQFCKIVNSSTESLSQQLSLQVQEILDFLLPLGSSTITVTGGSTMARIADYFSSDISVTRNLSFVPARGGVGGSTVIQANSVSEQMALKTDSEHYSLYVPEHVSRETYFPLMQEPIVAQTILMMKHAQCLLYSVGNATIMAERRGLSPEDSQILAAKRAVGEAFGCFFNAEGKVVFKLPRVGLHLSDLETIPYNIAIVEGAQKAEALQAYAKLAPVERTWFVVDESLANMVLNGETR